MTDWKAVQGSQAARPAEIDTTSSAVTVYQRRNIERTTVENDDGTATELWRYDERQMTRGEYADMRAASMSAVAAIAFVTLSETGAIDDVTAGEHPEMFAEWEPEVSYAPGNIRRYSEQLYRCIQAHTSQADWTPDTAVSLWTRIADPAEEWPEWSQPVGAHDAYAAGDKVSHNGKHWTSSADGNVWEPGVYGWEEYIAPAKAKEAAQEPA